MIKDGLQQTWCFPWSFRKPLILLNTFEQSIQKYLGNIKV